MKIIDTAKKYLGQKEQGNNAFSDANELGKKLHAAGQRDGEAWCAYFGEAMCNEAYPEKGMDIAKLFSASAVSTFKNLVAAGLPVTAVPRLGAIVIWQRYEAGKPGWQGHLGIVSKVNGSMFSSIEGNSNAAGSRDSDSVVENSRSLYYKDTGLNVMGFINLGWE